MNWWTRAVPLFGGSVLSIRPSHVSALAVVPDLHRNLFDRIPVSQAIADGWPSMTSDQHIASYPVQVIW